MATKRKSWGDRGSRQSRGYGAVWDATRLAILRAEPLCRHCERQGRVTLAVEVDHVVPRSKGGQDNIENLCPLCHACHLIKSARDAGRKVCDAIGLDAILVI